MRYVIAVLAFFLTLAFLDYFFAFYALNQFAGIFRPSSSLAPVVSHRPVVPPPALLLSSHDLQPYWVTVEPKTKTECLSVSRGELNPAYVRCISGYQQHVQKDSQGNIRVLSERPIPVPTGQGIYR